MTLTAPRTAPRRAAPHTAHARRTLAERRSSLGRGGIRATRPQDSISREWCSVCQAKSRRGRSRMSAPPAPRAIDRRAMPFHGWRIVAIAAVAQGLGFGLLSAYGFLITPLAEE